MSKEYYPFNYQIQLEDMIRKNNHKPLAIWLYGLSGAGKSTLADQIQKRLFAMDFQSVVLDGDSLRTGINNDLGFSKEDRNENIRRTAEIAKMLVNQGIITISALITPLEEQREMAKSIIGEEYFFDIFVDCPFSLCEERDVKGLYARARNNQINQFTGYSSMFERPASPPALTINTLEENIHQCVDKIFNGILDRIETRLRVAIF